MLIQGKATKCKLSDLNSGDVFVIAEDVAEEGDDAVLLIKLDETDESHDDLRLCVQLSCGVIFRLEDDTEVVPKPNARLVIE